LIAKAGEKVATATSTNRIEIEPKLKEATKRFARLEEIIRPIKELSSSRLVIRLGALAKVFRRCRCSFSPGSFLEPGRFTFLVIL
jgi:hypothetical protein